MSKFTISTTSNNFSLNFVKYDVWTCQRSIIAFKLSSPSPLFPSTLQKLHVLWQVSCIARFQLSCSSLRPLGDLVFIESQLYVCLNVVYSEKQKSNYIEKTENFSFPLFMEGNEKRKKVDHATKVYSSQYYIFQSSLIGFLRISLDRVTHIEM